VEHIPSHSWLPLLIVNELTLNMRSPLAFYNNEKAAPDLGAALPFLTTTLFDYILSTSLRKTLTTKLISGAPTTMALAMPG
jgi:hypothetical protein